MTFILEEKKDEFEMKENIKPKKIKVEIKNDRTSRGQRKNGY